MPAPRHGERYAVEDGAGDLLDQVDLASHVARAPGGDRYVPLGRDLEAEALEHRPLLVGRDLEADQAVGPLGTQVDDRTLRERPLDVRRAGHPRAREVDDQAARELRGRLREIRVDALLPAIRARGPERMPFGAPQDPERLEVRCLEQHLGRLVPDLALLAAHDRGERDGPVGVGDHEIRRLELPFDAVERTQALACSSAAHDDSSLRKPGAIEHVQRAAPDVHHVVRHVDDVRDRAHVGQMEPRAQPLRRGADLDVPKHAADVTRAAFEVLDPDVHGFLVDDERILDLGQVQLTIEERGHLAPEPDHRQEVDAVHRRRHVEHAVADRQDVEQRPSRLEPVRKHHDPGVVVPEAYLVLGEDHPARGLAA